MTKAQQLYLKIASFTFNHSNKFRIWLYKKAGMRIGESCFINKFFTTTNNIQIGNHCYLNRFCRFVGVAHDGKVIIGNNVFIAFGVDFCLATHELGRKSQRAGIYYNKDIEVGDGTWICTNVTILPGVKIGKGCIIAAGSVVNKDCEDNYLYGGVPAKQIKKLLDDETFLFK